MRASDHSDDELEQLVEVPPLEPGKRWWQTPEMKRLRIGAVCWNAYYILACPFAALEARPAPVSNNNFIASLDHSARNASQSTPTFRAKVSE